MSKKIVEPKTIIIASLIAVPVIFFLLLLAYYHSSLLNFTGILDKDFFPAFGSFFGSIAGVILSLGSILLIYYTYQSQQEQLKITKGLVNRQIALSIKPDIAIQDYYTPNPIKDFISAKPDFDGILPNDLQGIRIKILNVGVEVARYIEYRFEYDVMGLIAYMNTSFLIPPLKLSYELNKPFGTVKRIETGTEHDINILSSIQPQEKGYLMPYKLDKDYLTVLFPIFYVTVYYYMLVGKFKDSDSFDTELTGFPKCLLIISYSDLEGVKHTKRFNLKTILLGGSEFLKPEKAQNIKLKISAAEVA